MTMRAPLPRRALTAGSALAVTLTLAVGCGSETDDATLATAPPSSPPTSTVTEATTDNAAVVEPLAGHYVPEVVAAHPHDARSFTQGLEWYGDRLLESRGLRGASSLALLDPATGEADWLVNLADTDLFAEGLTVIEAEDRDRVLQLTWTSRTLLTTDLPNADDPLPPTYRRQDDAYDGEGWGLCNDGSRLVMSNGSSLLVFRRFDDFSAIGSVEVTLNGLPVEQLNELECVGGQVLANVWQSNTIVVIDPDTGIVEATIDASNLVPDGYENSTDDVLNGIAHHPERGTFWLTGKRWPTLYEVRFVRS
ncbi:MAG: glutaminyl-peptide cyclotransferase [Actinomycetota bacterium]